MHNPPCFLIFFLLFASTFCHGSDLTTVEVVGVGECADCYKNNIKTNHAFSGSKFSLIYLTLFSLCSPFVSFLLHSFIEACERVYRTTFVHPPPIQCLTCY